MQAIRKVLVAGLVLALLAGVASAAPIIGAKADEGSDKWLIDDAEVVMVLNAKTAFKSELLTKGVVADAMKKAMEDDRFKDGIKKMGLDPTKDLDSVIVSAAGFGPKVKWRAVLQGRFDKDKIADAMKKNDKVTVVKSGGVDVFEIEGQGDKKFYAAIGGKGSFMVFTDTKEATADLAKSGPTKAAKKNKMLEAALKRFTGKESMAVAMVLTDELKKEAEKIPNPQVAKAIKSVNSLTYSLTVTSGVDLLVVGYTKDGEAKALAKQLTAAHKLGELFIGMAERIPMALVDLYGDIKIDNTRDTVTVTLKMSKDLIEKLAKMAPGGDK